MSRPPTIEDVAQAAGVSVATVSRALRGLPNVAPSTRDRVADAAARLHYRADPSASALATGRTRTIAMAVPVLDSWYFAKVMAGAEAVLSQEGYDLLLVTIDSDQRRRRVLGAPLLKRADGLIMVDLRMPPDERAALLRTDMAIVAVGMELEGARAVMVDDRWIARTAVDHLAGLGHRKIALIGGIPDDPLRFSVPAERAAGYEEALHLAGLEVRDDYLEAGNFSIDGGREAMERLLELDDPPTAVFAMSDEMAFGALSAMWRRGLRAPADVSVIGVDDHEMAELLGLTTMQQNVAEHGAVAARMLLEALQGSGEVRRHTADAGLVERRTTGAPPD